MSISIKSAKSVVPFESFDLSHFGLHVNSVMSSKGDKAIIWTISLLCVLDVSKDESLLEILEVEMSETFMCCGLIPARAILLNQKENRNGEETLWSIILEASLSVNDHTRLMDVSVNIETRRPRKKKARTIAQALVDNDSASSMVNEQEQR